MAKIAKAGRLICFDQGEYSDYGVIGFFVALKDFEPDKELAAYLEQNPDKKAEYRFDCGGFLAYLLAQGLLVEVEYSTFYLGEYGCAKSVRFDE